MTRDGAALAALLVFAAVAGIGVYTTTDDVPAETAPDATFEVRGDAADGVVVAHAGGEAFESGALAVLVYEDRPVVPDRTVHRTTWEAEGAFLQAGAELRLEDPRFEPGQRLVVRWFGEAGQANLYETAVPAPGDDPAGSS